MLRPPIPIRVVFVGHISLSIILHSCGASVCCTHTLVHSRIISQPQYLKKLLTLLRHDVLKLKCITIVCLPRRHIPLKLKLLLQATKLNGGIFVAL